MKKSLLLALAALLGMCLGARGAEPEMIVFPSQNLHQDDTVLVFSPAGMASVRELPTAFVLHGYSGCYRDWSNHMDMQALANETGFRLICPDGFYASWYINNADPAGMQWRTFFWEECWPQLDKLYGLNPGRSFITGLSMGGHGAMNIFLDHPERFKGAGSMSGVLALKYSGGSRKTIPALLGAADIEDPKCARQSATNRLERVKEVCGEAAVEKILVVSCGTGDKTFFPASVEFAQRCQELGLRYVSLFSPGKHEWPYWTWVIKYHLRIFADEMTGTQVRAIESK